MNVYEIITNRIVEQIEEAKKTGKRFRWVKPWTGGPSAPVSYTTGKEYRGINRLILRPGEYITFKGLMDVKKSLPEDVDVFVKKGEHKLPVFFYNTYEKKLEDGTPILDEYGNPAKGSYLKFYQVFDRESIHGLPSHYPAVKTVHTDLAQAEMVERYLEAYCEAEGITIDRVEDGTRAFYSPAKNLIRIPAKEGFKSLYAYYGTLLHEAIHSTAKGTGRVTGKSFGDGKYSREELLAELSSQFLLNHFRLADDDTESENNIAYIDGWASKLKESKSEIAKAAAQAEKAMQYFLNTAEAHMNISADKSA